jgi:hypothetical protein
VHVPGTRTVVRNAVNQGPPEGHELGSRMTYENRRRFTQSTSPPDTPEKNLWYPMTPSQPLRAPLLEDWVMTSDE